LSNGTKNERIIKIKEGKIPKKKLLKSKKDEEEEFIEEYEKSATLEF